MAKIDIPYKNTGEELTASEFNQVLDALKSGLRDIETKNITARDGHFQGNVVIDGSLSVGGMNFVKEINDLSDVVIVSPSNGNVLIFDDGVWKNDIIDGGLF